MLKEVFAKTHAEFLNQAFGTNYRGFMKTRFPYDEDTWVWMVSIDGKVRNGWKNVKVSENEIWEEYVLSGDPTYSKNQERTYRIAVDVTQAKNGRKYCILGKYEFDFENSTSKRHILRKIKEV
jgi:hypothetical protein